MINFAAKENHTLNDYEEMKNKRPKPRGTVKAN
jgi:hypothetical protein